MKEAAPKVRRQYDPTFNREAVEHGLASGKSAEDIARRLGIGSGGLCSWRRCLVRTGNLVRPARVVAVDSPEF